MADTAPTGEGEDLRRRQQQQQRQELDEAAGDGEEVKEKIGRGGQARRTSRFQLHHGDGSWTRAFVAVDYLFLLIFLGFLCFFLLQIWRGASG